MFAEEWASLAWLEDHGPSHPDWVGVLDGLIANGKRIDELKDRKYK